VIAIYLQNRLDDDLQQELLREYEETKDEEKKELLILHNLRLVKYFSGKYAKVDSPGRDEEDLFQEGIIGLMNAIRTYDPESGKFSTYAAQCIKSSIFNYIRDRSSSLRIPAHRREKLHKIIKAKEELLRELQRQPTDKEISDLLSIPVDEIRYLKLISREVISLDLPVGEDEDMMKGDTIEDPSSQFEETICSSLFIEEFYKNMQHELTAEEFEVIRLSLGLYCRVHSYKEVADIMNLESPKQAQSIREKGMRTLRKKTFIQSLLKDRSIMREVEKEVDDMTRWYSSPTYGGVKTSRDHTSGSNLEDLAIQRIDLKKKALDSLYQDAININNRMKWKERDKDDD
jgi:RNA polymerase sigma factor (sigma-70 family)